jgi:two-component system cell cycle response regulator
MKILIADDDPVSLRILERMLQQSGYEVVKAHDGLQAAAILAQPGAPRLAIIDWMMPGLDGPGVCRQVRARKHDRDQDEHYVYILLLTAKQAKEDVVSGLSAGADDYLTKPCHPAELEARLHTGRRILQLEDKLVEAREEMQFKATHDGLTTLWNRTAILALLQSELSRAIRGRAPVSLILCDIDHFKRINDVHGHPAGDEVLREVSRRLLDSVRKHDAVGRYGGEEFLIVLGGCDASNLQMRAEQIRRRIADHPFSVSGGALTIPVSLSAGALTILDWDTKTPIEPFIKQADDSLYQAKAAGRNRILFAETLVPA